VAAERAERPIEGAEVQTLCSRNPLDALLMPFSCGGQDSAQRQGTRTAVGFSRIVIGAGQHIGERFLFGNPQLGQHLPIARTGDAIEKLQSAVGDFQRSRRELTVVDQIQQVFTHLLLGKLIGGQVIKASQLANFAEVPIMGPLFLATQLEVSTHLLPQREGWLSDRAIRLWFFGISLRHD